MSRTRRVLGYARVSSEEQARGSSLQDQQDAISAYAQARGLKVARFYVESESAVHEKIERREQIRALLIDASAGDLVICDKLDRWSRDTEFTLRSVRELREKGVDFYSVTDQCAPSTRDGDMMLTMRAMFAKEEHRRIKERMVGTRQILRDKGYYVEGLPPFGYRRAHPRGYKGVEKNVLVIEESEAATVRRAMRMCIAGKSLSAIAGELGQKRDRIADIIHGRIYVGEIRNSRGEWIPGKHPAIVDVDTFARAEAILKERRLGGARPRKAPAETDAWVLRDVAVCGRCGARMGAAYGQRQERRRYYFRCSRHCGARLVPVPATEDVFAPIVVARFAELRDELGSSPPVAAPPLVDFAGRLEKIQRKRERFFEAFADETMSREELRAAIARLDAERLRIEAEERAQRRPDALSEPAARRDALREVRSLEAAWRKATPAIRRALVRIFASTVAVELADGVTKVVPTWRSAKDLLESD